jgi:uncharacterized protein YdaU (DUF1376 family)
MGNDKKKKPIWMPLYVTDFIADTAGLTATQGWAYINLLVAMWRSDDGTLPNDADKLARVGKVPTYRWAKVWSAIKSLFDVDGDRVTSVPLQAELGKANAMIATRRAAARMGGLTTQFRRATTSAHLRRTATAPKPLKNNDGAQASAKHNYNHNSNKTEEEGESSPLPCDSKASASLEKEASSGERVVKFPISQPPTSPEGHSPSEEERARRLAISAELKRKLRGGSAR